MATVQDAIDGLMDLVGAVSGIKGAPDQPPDKLGPFPFAVSWAFEGVFTPQSHSQEKGLHDIVLWVVVEERDMKYDVKTLNPFVDSVAEAILADVTLSGNVQTFARLRYRSGTLIWAGVEYRGIRFLLEGVKIAEAFS